MKINIIGYAIIFLVLIICLRVYRESDVFNLKCIISDVDGKKYCVRERNKLELAADRLANANKNMQGLVDHCNKEYPDRDNIKRLVKGYNPKKIYETLPTSQYTAYSENKGEKLAFCLDTEKNGGTLIDPNTLTFVAIHELSHVASKSIGHTDEFWNNFKFLLGEAKKINIYNPIDYKNKPARYCGMTISDNPYFDV
jgi:hypothetical protein|tara:strand:- start:268 stop:858 length:591 start_codon:yes stop_codon:yes gene_type:complete